MAALVEQDRDVRVGHLRLLRRLADDGPGAAPDLAGELLSWSKRRAKDLEERHERERAELLDAYGVERSRDLPAGVSSRLDTRHEREKRQASAEALDQVLDDVASWLRDLLALAGGADPSGVVNRDLLDELRADAELLDPGGAMRGLAAVAECREALDRNGNARLQLERLLLALSMAVLTPAGG